jgi:hypothetical protein
MDVSSYWNTAITPSQLPALLAFSVPVAPVAEVATDKSSQAEAGELSVLPVAALPLMLPAVIVGGPYWASPQTTKNAPPVVVTAADVYVEVAELMVLPDEPDTNPVTEPGAYSSTCIP